jgi:hypothetical protein
MQVSAVFCESVEHNARLLGWLRESTFIRIPVIKYYLAGNNIIVWFRVLVLYSTGLPRKMPQKCGIFSSDHILREPIAALQGMIRLKKILDVRPIRH